MNKSQFAQEGFQLEEGQRFAGRFYIIEKLGAGSEGEVYRALESHTNQERAVKLFYPERNPKFKVSSRYANKLDKLRNCPIVMDYLSHEVIEVEKVPVAVLVSELIKGEILADFVAQQRGKRLGVFPAIHLLYSVVKGLEAIHDCGEYHGDLHTENVMIQRFGLEFDLKIIDMHHWGDSKQSNREEDIVKAVRLFYDILGGAPRYKQLPQSLKYIICGLKRSLILDRFKKIRDLRLHLERVDWSDAV